MTQFNLISSDNIDKNYNSGLLPQRNKSNIWYQESSCRSNLKNFSLTSENRRILKKTEQFIFKKIALSEFNLTHAIQKQISSWVKELGWKFPTNSIKTIFTNHIFNNIYIWENEKKEVIAYSICYFSQNISHIAYVFYNPEYSHTNLPIRLVLQTIIDSKNLNLEYCYLGRFSKENGFYKRNMPGFEYFLKNNWVKY